MLLVKDEANAIRSVVNKSLEQGIVTEDLALRIQRLIKRVRLSWLVANL
jgi:3-isopropylmalate dehydrogenase